MNFMQHLGRCHNASKLKNIIKSVTNPKYGDILVYNSTSNLNLVVTYDTWLTLSDQWDITGLYGINTYDEENAENGFYVIMSNGTTLIIDPNDYSKVSSHWEHVDTITTILQYDYVDLGLPSGTKWAIMNVGASSETDYGNYYQYGKGADDYSVTSGDSNYGGTEDPLDSSVDTASQVWGGSWHMPTKTQFEELIANTTYQWVTDFNGSGINGGKFTAQNGNYVFFPAAGYWYNGSQNSVGNNGNYWGSSPNGSDNAYRLYFGNGSKDVYSSNRKGGYSVRGVLDE